MARQLNILLIIGAIIVCASIFFLPPLVALGVSGVAFILLLAAFNMLWRGQREPLRALRDSAAALADGDLDADIASDEDPELASIGESLNTLRHALHKKDKAAQSELQALTTQLQSRDEELEKTREEISDNKARIHELSNYDQLTSLPRRGLFIEQLGLLLSLARRENQSVAVLCIGLQNFDRLKRTLGRGTADEILQAVGERLSGCLQDRNIFGDNAGSDESLSISRLGGDEFAIAMGDLQSADEASEASDRISEVLLQPLDLQGQQVLPSPVIGIAMAPRDGWDAESLLRYAGSAKQRAVSDKRTNHVHFSADQDIDGNNELTMIAALRAALENDEFTLHYQPQVNITYGSIASAEAFLRWDHAEFGEVSPHRFVPLAEEVGLMGELGDWVIVQACKQMKEFSAQGLELPRVALNISPQQLTPEFVPRLDALLKAAELPPSALELGLPEGVLADDDGTLLDLLKALQSRGVALALENFGTTRSSLSNITRYPLDDIKIDRGFVAGCDHRDHEGQMVNAIIAMAEALDLQAVAEGVETASEYRYLAGRGVRMMRGYLFSKPVPADELARQLAAPWPYMERIQQMNSQ